jgi:predicted DNA-binding antitoxin AbrB/MazE fold protein
VIKLVTTIPAVYEKGVFKPLEIINLKEHQPVEITISTIESTHWKLEFNSLLESIHHHTAKFSSSEIESDITLAAEEVKEKEHVKTRTR